MPTVDSLGGCGDDSDSSVDSWRDPAVITVVSVISAVICDSVVGNPMGRGSALIAKHRELWDNNSWLF